MDVLDRIDAAEKKFNAEFGGMDDEWTEMFGNACAFARGLVDSPDKTTLDAVVHWIELAAEEESNY